MSFVNTESLFSNFKNNSFHPDIRPNDSTSNIFRSIFDNLELKDRSIKVESIFQVQGNFHPPRQNFSLMDKIINSGPKQVPPPAYHYNWIVCKNNGLSQEEDNIDHVQEKSKKSTSSSEFKSEAAENVVKVEVAQIDYQKCETMKKMKNETKNIPKNYGKAIISFIEKNRSYIQEITSLHKVDYDELLGDLKKKKKSINTIADLRGLWSNYRFAKCMRVITFVFLRKHALKYIFDSRICTYSSHIKYRQRLCEAVANPEQFNHIKDY